MTEFYILMLVALIIWGGLGYPKWRDQRILQQVFPEPWQGILEKRLPFVHKLDSDEQSQLRDLIKLFIAKKQFHGCGGLKINDDMRVTIAAEACLLLLNRKTGVYPSLKHILVYPDAFKSDRLQHNQDGTVSQTSTGLLGESWSSGKVILSWDDVSHGAANFADGHNVVLHEFAHQLDGESGYTNGAPPLRKNSYQVWAKVLSKEYEDLLASIERNHKTVMDYYGATNPAEFFAVATETFFEKPRQMASKHPELFAELKAYYRVDPEAWI